VAGRALRAEVTEPAEAVDDDAVQAAHVGDEESVATEPATVARSTVVGCQAGVEQLTRYLELLDRDPLLAPVHGIFAAQEIKLQARTLAEDRGIRCVAPRLRRDARRGAGEHSVLKNARRQGCHTK
jgi:hypothetical protein